MSVLPRVRLQLARRPWIYWLVVGLCSLLAWSSVLGAQADARRAQRAWGSSQTVYVADRALAPGDPVRATTRQYPVTMVPSSAIATLEPDALAARAVSPGEVLVATDVAADRLLPAGWVVFAVATDVAPQLLAGDTVVVYGQGVRWCEGVVGAVADGVVEVAVPPDDAEAVSALVAVGDVVLARAGGRS
ncbi:MAG TPA: hypothetical protein PLV13_01910 [Ilumatobacteraceae bacterium]|nr:hypothetical protein [Ilumatobacteraceae bacterium]